MYEHAGVRHGQVYQPDSKDKNKCINITMQDRDKCINMMMQDRDKCINMMA